MRLIHRGLVHNRHIQLGLVCGSLVRSRHVRLRLIRRGLVHNRHVPLKLIRRSLIRSRHVDFFLCRRRLLQDGALAFAVARHQECERRAAGVFAKIGNGDDQHLLGFNHCAIGQSGNRRELVIAWGYWEVGHQHPLAAPIGGLGTEYGRPASHRHFGAGLRAPCNHRAAVRLDAHSIEARRNGRDVGLFAGHRLFQNAWRSSGSLRLIHGGVGNDAGLNDGLFLALCPIPALVGCRIAILGLRRPIVANPGVGLVFMPSRCTLLGSESGTIFVPRHGVGAG